MPARDSKGLPTRGEYAQRVRWAIPRDKLTEQGSIISYSIGIDGAITGCNIRNFGHHEADMVNCDTFRYEQALSGVLGVDLSTLQQVDVGLQVTIVDPQSIIIPSKMYGIRKVISESFFDVSPNGVIVRCTTNVAEPLFGRKFDLCDGAIRIGSKEFEADPQGKERRLRVTFDFAGIKR